MTAREKAIQRINSLVFDTENCILCPTVGKDGYGIFQFRDPGKHWHIRAHRLSYELSNNVVLTKEQLVCHSCDTPACVNPKHLFSGSQNDNVQDKVRKGRQAKGKGNGRYVNGYSSKYDPQVKPKLPFEKLFGRKLNQEKVKAIKVALNNVRYKTLKELSNDFEVSYSTIVDIKNGRAYRDL
ncbi:MAG: hypothetical protein M0R17_01795 [Candidatus Omnitrophica bacterium]|jgi:hypothetical protein|nr:hypothetical protein [Candidatus Omnitrophota bacterium]